MYNKTEPLKINVSKIRRLRSIGEIINFIKKEDVETAVSRYAIETLILKRKVFYFKSGNKYLVDLDDVLSELCIYRDKE